MGDTDTGMNKLAEYSNVIFGVLFAKGILPVFSYFVIAINTIGAIGDLWIVTKLIPHARGTLVQDTESGIGVWSLD